MPTQATPTGAYQISIALAYDTVLPRVRWHSRSAEPVQLLQLGLRSSCVHRTVEASGDRDPAQVAFVGIAGVRDPLVQQIGLALVAELEAPSGLGAHYAQRAAQLLAVHLLRHYTVKGGGGANASASSETDCLWPRSLLSAA